MTRGNYNAEEWEDTVEDDKTAPKRVFPFVHFVFIRCIGEFRWLLQQKYIYA